MKPFRIEHDSLGEIAVPDDALHGAQTQRAIDNFAIGGRPMPVAFVDALLLIKAAAARANGALGELPERIATAVARSADRLRHDPQRMRHFPVDVFQTGSGTSSNMNANEVLATLARQMLDDDSLVVSPNDTVNRGQSSNDVIPSAIHVAATLQIHHDLLPALRQLSDRIRTRRHDLGNVVKTGRTHLMDAMPVRFGQVLEGWASQLDAQFDALEQLLPRLRELALGGTAVGTGVNAHPQFAAQCCRELSISTAQPFVPTRNHFAAIGSQDSAVALSGVLRGIAVSLMKIANDLRWMNSGPLAGLGEITLPALQPGSSIMPGKVNPVIPEAVAMAAARVIGHDATVTVAAQSGNFELNVMLPVIADALLDSIALLSRSATHLGDKAIAGFTLNQERLAQPLHHNPMLATALNPLIGYAAAARIAKTAARSGRPVLDVAIEHTGLDPDLLARHLDPRRLTGPDDGI